MPQALSTSAFRASTVLVLVGLSIVFLRCSDSRPNNPDRSPRNIVILCLDTLRVDRMATYGHYRATTPRIDQMAQRGAVFERTLSQSNWTIPATASLLTSLYPSEHGAGVKQARGEIRNLDKSAVRRLRADTRSLGQVLSDAGFQTALL